MADIPQRLYVLQKLTDHLAGITPANSYAFDLTDKVFRGRAVFNDSMPLPALSILESVRPDIGVQAGAEGQVRKEQWNLLLQGWVEDDLINPSDPGYYLMAAVEKRLSEITLMDPRKGTPSFPDVHLLGTHPNGSGYLLTSFEFGPGIVRPPVETVSSKAFFYLPLRVGLATKAGEPYISG